MYLKTKIALAWLALGFHLVPLQPNTKKIIPGFGRWLRKITTRDEAIKWFGESSRYNLGVVCNDNNFVLDFDDWNLYVRWAKLSNEAYTTSYTEYSPNGGVHVFLNGDIVKGLKLIDGVEIKKTVTVFPSVIDGKPYTQAAYPNIFSGNVDDCFFLLSEPGTPTAYLLRTKQINQTHETQNKKTIGGGDKVSQIKKHLTVLDVLRQHAPSTYASLKGDGRFRSGLCPLHKGKGQNGMEVNPSFWVDTENDIYGCHACRSHKPGDVINLYAEIKRVTVREAIQTLSESLKGENHVAV